MAENISPMDLFMMYLQKKNPQAAAVLGNALSQGQVQAPPPSFGPPQGGIAAIADTTPYVQGGNVMGTGMINDAMKQALARKMAMDQIAGGI